MGGGEPTNLQSTLKTAKWFKGTDLFPASKQCPSFDLQTYFDGVIWLKFPQTENPFKAFCSLIIYLSISEVHGDIYL